MEFSREQNVARSKRRSEKPFKCITVKYIHLLCCELAICSYRGVFVGGRTDDVFSIEERERTKELMQNLEWR
jgi:hypothetical protein